MVEMDIPAGETNLLDAIGGPGTVLIEPGNAVIFRKLNEASDISITQAYFLEPFEKIGSIASLEDQEGSLDDVRTVSRDGIRVRLWDVHFRYRIVPMVVDGRMINRTLDSPYPYSEEAMRSMAYNLSINADGPDPWSAAVHRNVGELHHGLYIKAHDRFPDCPPHRWTIAARRHADRAVFRGQTGCAEKYGR
jgi:hypothetical protein